MSDDFESRLESAISRGQRRADAKASQQRDRVSSAQRSFADVGTLRIVFHCQIGSKAAIQSRGRSLSWISERIIVR